MKTVLVTGGAKGIGKGIALKFAKEGYSVCINYFRSETQAKETLAEISKISKGFAVKGDVSKEPDVEKIVAFAVEKMGKIDVLVNDAGFVGRKPGTQIVELSEEEWDEVMDINVKGVFLMTKHVAKHMIDKKIKGRIVNISSTAGLGPTMLSGAHYASSKHAVVGFTRNSARELSKHGILVNSVAPGFVRTDMIKVFGEEKLEAFEARTPTGSFSTPEDIAEAVFFLANARNTNGQTLVVDGGTLMH